MDRDVGRWAKRGWLRGSEALHARKSNRLECADAGEPPALPAGMRTLSAVIPWERWPLAGMEWDIEGWVVFRGRCRSGALGTMRPTSEARTRGAALRRNADAGRRPALPGRRWPSATECFLASA